jgi:hypothetical protein
MFLKGPTIGRKLTTETLALNRFEGLWSAILPMAFQLPLICNRAHENHTIVAFEDCVTSAVCGKSDAFAIAAYLAGRRGDASWAMR